MKDGQIIKEIITDGTFVKTFEINNHPVTIIQHGEKYELRIDNQLFGHLLDLEKNKKFFDNSHITSTSNVTTNNFKMEMNKKTQNFGTGIINSTINNINKNKPALFNFAIKPADQQKPEFSNRKFGGGEIEKTKNENLNFSANNNNNNNLIVNTNSQNLFDLSESTNKMSNNSNINNDLFGFGNNTSNIVTNENISSNNKILDPYDLINSFGNSNNQQGNNNPLNSNSLPNQKDDKAQNLIDLMFSNNGNNGNYVDLSNQNQQNEFGGMTMNSRMPLANNVLGNNIQNYNQMNYNNIK